jgi:hypothetical protein
MIVLSACLVLAGCMSLALSQEQNWKIVAGGSSVARERAVLRIFGWVLLGAALGVCIAAEGRGFGVLVWGLLATSASFSVAMTLSFRPGMFKPIARACSALWSGQ